MFNYLFITTKWFSDDGGIQTVNRKLCMALAKRNKVSVLVTDEGRPNSDEEKNADELGIKLYKRDKLSDILKENTFDFVCTHSTFTGRYIATIKDIVFPNKDQLKFIHFLHHDPEDIEHLKEYVEKGQDLRNQKKDVEVDIAVQADYIITMGESLKDKYINRIITRNAILENCMDYIDGGIEVFQDTPYKSTKSPEVLIAGRTSSLVIKGLDIYAKVAKNVHNKLKLERYQVTFVVRGEDGNLDSLYKKLQEISKSEINFNIKEFTTDQKKLSDDLANAAVCIIPSHVEGYGLVAMEAISKSVPIIISSNAGVANLIISLKNKQVISDGVADECIWQFGTNDEDIENLATKIIHILKEQEDARTRTTSLRTKMNTIASWESGAKKIEEICEKILGIELMKNDEQGIQLFMKRVDPYLRLYDHALESAKEKIQITSIKLKKLRTKQKEMLLEKSKTVKVEILLLDPSFPIPTESYSIAQIREAEEKLEAGEIKTEVIEWKKFFYEYQSTIQPNVAEGAGLEIKLFQSLPTVNMIRTDSKMFVGTFLLTKEGNEHHPTFIVENKENTMGEKLFQSYLEHFENLKKNSRSINDFN